MVNSWLKTAPRSCARLRLDICRGGRREAGDRFGHTPDKRWFVPLTPMRDRGKIRGVGLDEQPVVWHEAPRPRAATPRAGNVTIPASER